MNYKRYTSARMITHLNVLLLLISFVGIYIFGISLNFENLTFNTFIILFIFIYLLASIFKFLIVSLKQFSITDHWMESIKLHLIFISSVGQEIFFRGILNQILGIYFSTLIYTFWNFFPSKRRVGVIIFFFFLGLVQSQIYLQTNNILYVIYSNFLFHILIRMIKYKLL